MITTIPYPQTVDSARAWLRQHGISQAEFARRHGVRREVVALILTRPDERKGLRGQSRAMAIALGLRKSDDAPLSGGHTEKR